MLNSSYHKVTDYLVKPWKNGLGKSLEIAVDSENPFRWRISMATLSASGPFSLYPGYDRTLVLLDGEPIAISHVEKKGRLLSPLVAYSFKGEWNTEVAVSSPASDFNVFALAGKCKAGVYPTFMRRGEDLQFPIAGTEHFIFCVSGQIEILEPNTEKTFSLGAHETLHLSKKSAKEFLNLRARGASENAVGLWVVVRTS